MSLDDLLTELSARGIVIAANGDRLRVDAPAGALTPDLRATLLERRDELLAHLVGRQELAAGRPSILRIPLELGSCPSEWLAARGLKIIGGTPYFGGALRPMLYLATSATNSETSKQ